LSTFSSFWWCYAGLCGTQDLTCAGRLLYHLSHPASPRFTLSVGLVDLQRCTTTIAPAEGASVSIPHWLPVHPTTIRFLLPGLLSLALPVRTVHKTEQHSKPLVTDFLYSAWCFQSSFTLQHNLPSTSFVLSCIRRTFGWFPFGGYKYCFGETQVQVSVWCFFSRGCIAFQCFFSAGV
jgi:hypothetical protein